MKRYALLIASVVALVLAATVGASSASADVPRHQPTATLTVSLTAYPGYVHTFTIAWADACGTSGAFSGTGHGSTQAGGATETITGTLMGGKLKFTAIYTSFIPGYTWNESMFAITWNVAPITTYKNHGAYVSAMGGGSDAAHSCIGMPIGP